MSLATRKKHVYFSILMILLVMGFFVTPASAAVKKVPYLKTEKRVAIDKAFSLKLENNEKPVKWTISKEGIVEFSPTTNSRLTLTAVGAGTTKVTANIIGTKQKFTCKVTVYDPVKVTGSSGVYLNKSCTLKLEGTDQIPVWSVTNSDVAEIETVSKSKIKVTVRAKSVGTAYVKAKVGSRTYRHKITVTKNKEKLKIAVADCNSGEDAMAQCAINRLGAIATIVSSDCKVSKYDGLIIPGGVDINPSRYHKPNTSSYRVSDYQDKEQLKLIKKFVKAGKPVFGICRGEQLINVYFGGTLKQNISNHGSGLHNIKTKSGSRMRRLYGKKTSVNSSHHQAVQKLGKGLTATAWAEDGTIEAIEYDKLPVFAVQWHPELMGSKGNIVLKDFLKLCKKYRDQ